MEQFTTIYKIIQQYWFWFATELAKVLLVLLALSAAFEAVAPGFVSLTVSLDRMRLFVVVYIGIYCIIGVASKQWKRL